MGPAGGVSETLRELAQRPLAVAVVAALDGGKKIERLVEFFSEADAGDNVARERAAGERRAWGEVRFGADTALGFQAVLDLFCVSPSVLAEARELVHERNRECEEGVDARASSSRRTQGASRRLAS